METINPKGKNVSRETADKIFAYAKLTEEWNHHLNLTGAKNAQEFFDTQIEDCLNAVVLIPQADLWIDVGSGVGLPGIPWALVQPEHTFLLVESLGKRVAFLHRVISLLKLSNVKIFEGRFEALNEASLPKKTEKLKIVSRGTDSPVALLKLAAQSSLPWESWFVFSTEKSHKELLKASAEFGIECRKLSYSRERFKEPGLLTELRRNQ